MLKVLIDTSTFMADYCKTTPKSKAQHRQELRTEQMIPCVAVGETEGFLFDIQGKKVGKWKECAN